MSSGIHVTAASDDTMFTTTTPETETHAGSMPPRPDRASLAVGPGLRRGLRYPSLPGNLDVTAGLAEIQKHLSDPVMSVI